MLGGKEGRVGKEGRGSGGIRIGMEGNVGNGSAMLRGGGNAGKEGSEGSGSGGIRTGIAGRVGKGRSIDNVGGNAGKDGSVGSGNGGMRIGISKLQLLMETKLPRCLLLASQLLRGRSKHSQLRYHQG